MFALGNLEFDQLACTIHCDGGIIRMPLVVQPSEATIVVSVAMATMAMTATTTTVVSARRVIRLERLDIGMSFPAFPKKSGVITS